MNISGGHSFIYEYLWRVCYEPDTILDPTYAMEKKKGEIPALMDLVV